MTKELTAFVKLNKKEAKSVKFFGMLRVFIIPFRTCFFKTEILA